jgi:16S rRNA (guanine(966)-N(2))-methyltransferase RsmD
MRIIAGEFRSRRLHTPPDDSITRPIPDRVKESLFGLLRGHCEGANVFDGFAGTGALGLEVVSRGAARCVFVEQDKSIAAILSKNVEMLGVKDRCEVAVGDALGAGALARSPRPLTLAFLDPPYPLIQEPVGFRRVMAQIEKLVEVLSPDGFVVLRTPWPLRHRQGPAPAAPSPTRRPKRRGRRDGPHGWRRGVEHEAPGRAGPITDVEPGSEETSENPMQDVKPVWLDVDLKLSTARGPETHAYHNMAVHLYMRKQV